jgi:hypothetical protein
MKSAILKNMNPFVPIPYALLGIPSSCHIALITGKETNHMITNPHNILLPWFLSKNMEACL